MYPTKYHRITYIADDAYLSPCTLLCVKQTISRLPHKHLQPFIRLYPIALHLSSSLISLLVSLHTFATQLNTVPTANTQFFVVLAKYALLPWISPSVSTIVSLPLPSACTVLYFFAAPSLVLLLTSSQLFDVFVLVR